MFALFLGQCHRLVSGGSLFFDQWHYFLNYFLVSFCTLFLAQGIHTVLPVLACSLRPHRHFTHDFRAIRYLLPDFRFALCLVFHATIFAILRQENEQNSVLEGLPQTHLFRFSIYSTLLVSFWGLPPPGDLLPPSPLFCIPLDRISASS